MLPRWLIKLGFHLLYYQLAWTYEGVAWLVSFGQWPAWRRLALHWMQPGRTLELAFGTGVFFIDMLAAGHRPLGVDLSPYMARQAGRRLRRRNLEPRLSRAQAQALPFPSDYFANVVATFPSDYMLEPATLAEIYRVLRYPASSQSAGRLIIVAEGQLRGPWPCRPVIDWLYKITNQRSLPPAKPLNLLAAHHFRARWEIVEHQGARARLLVAEKLGPASAPHPAIPNAF
ncbi:MAG: methyltransferase domain-containing protein [Chloroflexota bacterium]